MSAPSTAAASGLDDRTIQKIQSVFLKYPQVQKATLYGSRAKGNFKPGSDIDLTLIGPTLTMTEALRIEIELDDLFLPYKIDLSLIHQIEDAALLEHIERVGKDFYLRR